MPRERRQGGWYEASRYAAVGIEMAGAVVIGLLIGMGLDRWLGTAPWLALAGLVLGAAAGFRALVRTLRALQRDDEPLGPAPGAGRGEQPPNGRSGA